MIIQTALYIWFLHWLLTEPLDGEIIDLRILRIAAFRNRIKRIDKEIPVYD